MYSTAFFKNPGEFYATRPHISHPLHPIPFLCKTFSALAGTPRFVAYCQHIHWLVIHEIQLAGFFQQIVVDGGRYFYKVRAHDTKKRTVSERSKNGLNIIFATCGISEFKVSAGEPQLVVKYTTCPTHLNEAGFMMWKEGMEEISVLTRLAAGFRLGG
jgi:hypothetical protein